MATTKTTRPVRPHLVNDKHLTPMPKPTHREVGPLHWMWGTNEQVLWKEVEEYFNAKAAEGWQMVSVGPLRWGFAPCEPGEYIYRIVPLEEPYNYPSSQNYLSFLADSDVEIVHVLYGLYAIVRRKAELGPFEITGSVSSKLARLRLLNKRMVALLSAACAWMVVLFAMAIVFIVVNLYRPGDVPDPWFASFIIVWGAIIVVTMSFCGWFAYRNFRGIDASLADLVADSAIHD